MALGSVLLLALAALAATSFAPETSTASKESSLRSTRSVETQLRPPRSAGGESSGAKKHHTTTTTTEKPEVGRKSDKSDDKLYVTPVTGLREAFFKRCGERCEGFGATDCKCDRLWNFSSFN
jgi:hypothetical protein